MDTGRGAEAEEAAEQIWRGFERSSDAPEALLHALALLFEQFERPARARAVLGRAKSSLASLPPWVLELERRLPVKAPKVYLIYRSKDGPAAGELARALRVEWGIDVWFDQWEIRAGDNVIAMMEEGLAAADGGLVFVSREGLEAGWAAEEYAAILTRVIDGKGFIMPVLADFSATEALPPFLAARRRVDHRDVETIAREIYAQVGRESGSKPALGAAPARFELHCRLDLRGEGDELLVHYDGHEVRIPAQSLSDAFTGPLGEALAAKLHNHPGDAVLSICADDFGLLALPWEAARLPHGARYRPLALIPRLTVARTLECSSRVAALPGIDGPLRVLFVVASPRDDHDWEREQERILDGLERARLARPRVVFVEALPTLEGVRWQLDAEPFHVVHFVAHGGPGELLLEDERGQPEVVDGPRLAASLTDAAHPPLAVVFSVSASADGGDQSAMAGELLRAGVPRVIAMRGSVSEGYASELAGYFYAALAARPSVARALAESRRQLEAARAQRAQTSSTAASEPEYAKVMAFSRAEDLDAPLYDVTRPWDPPPEPRSLVPVRGMVSRPVGWVVGRRAEGQTLFAALTDPGHAGALVWGVGGSGKSTLATSLAQRLVRMGWAVVAVVGRFTVADLVRHARRQLTGQLVDSAAIRELVAIDDRQRAEESLDEQELLAPLARLLYAERVLLLLDNFEDNLPGDALPADLSGAGERPYRATPSRESLALFETLLPAARGAGAVLITCRFDLQEADELSRLGLGPVSPAAMRRLQWRLPGLMNLSPRERERTLALLGGHPRALEFADALLRTTSGRPEAAFVDILRRLEALARGSNEQLPDVVDASPRERVEQASRLVAEDVLLEALLATLDEESRRLLDAAAVYRRAVPLGAMKAVADAVGLDWDERRLREGIEVLVSRTLLAVAGPGARGSGQSWVVHRWIAARLQHEDERSKSAHLAAAKWWGDTFRNVDAILERIEHLIAARRLELADELAERLRFSTSRRGLSRFAYSLSERMLEVFTEPDRRRARWLANLAEHTEALVGNDEALALYLDSFQLFEDALARDPENKERLHDVLVGSGRLADLYRSMGKNEDARSCYERARSCYDRALSYYERGFEIAESLVRVASSIEQDDAKLNLVKIQSSLGMQLLQFGASDRAEQHLQASLDLANALARAHPDEVEFQLTLAQTYGRFGDLSLELNRHQQALESYQSCREILEPLASRSPMRLDIRDGLAAAYENLGLCQKDITLIDKAIEIYREWFEREPDRKKLLDQLARASLLKAEMAKRLCDEQSLVNARRDALPLLHHFRELDQRGGLAEDSRVYYEALEGEFGEAPS
nr:CHAT domain-containing protein [Pseudenhygromyxa sp. WMMC2535]